MHDVTLCLCVCLQIGNEYFGLDALRISRNTTSTCASCLQVSFCILEPSNILRTSATQYRLLGRQLERSRVRSSSPDRWTFERRSALVARFPLLSPPLGAEAFGSSVFRNPKNRPSLMAALSA